MVETAAGLRRRNYIIVMLEFERNRFLGSTKLIGT